MPKKIVAGNWKMNLTLEEGENLVEGLRRQIQGLSAERSVVIAPSFTHIAQTAKALTGTPHLYAGAQNCSSEPSGAYTGEVSAAMLKSAGCTHVILGHSERREYFQENSALLVKKMSQAFAQGLQVVFCCGEPLEVRDAGTQNDYVGKQLEEALFHLQADELQHLVIAYEPIWAIGTGRTASAAQAQEMHAHIRTVLAGKWGAEAAGNMTILYGGSCNAGNAKELFAQPDVDGGLIGGASLKVDTFLPIVQAMLEA